ncbi:DUF3826 domain-containing protein [Botryobacter ruber]|uniref:DUF3826 domain-containing protein n=1 Tax=Botryobacter ruber TaxID=2171629 RepID=UPI001F0BA612|nr:DUF3826 domain-containing protein [Botryobacter ruber]
MMNLNVNWKLKGCSLLLGVMLFSAAPAMAQKEAKPTKQEQEAAYIRVTNERADKIVANLGVKNKAKALRVRNLIAQQYRDLSYLHEFRDARVKAAKEGAGVNKKAAEERKTEIEAFTNQELEKLHKKYVANLQAELTPKQVDGVKDGMTYGVVPITYKGYQDMLPNLTEEQKKQIWDWLVEAREHAMDAGSSHEKHGWFGKYKGRINNYLSAAGYDLKKAGDEWQERIKAEAAAKEAAKK